MAAKVSSLLAPAYDILIEDADGRHLWLECHQDLALAEQRLAILSARFPGTRLVLWNHKTRTILAETDGY